MNLRRIGMADYVYYKVLVLLACATGTGALEITVEADKETILAGYDVTLTCRIKDWQPVSLVKWYKQVQLPQTKTELLSTKLNLQNPYKKYEHRYSVSLTEDGPDGVYQLIIKNITLQETGEYACTSMEDTSVIGQKQITVLTQSSDIYLANETAQLKDGDVISIVEGHRRNVTCVSTDSIPAPQMTIFAGERDITNEFSTENILVPHCTESQVDKECIIHVTHDQKKSSINGYEARFEDDGKALTCHSNIAEAGDMLPTKSVKAILDIHFAPRLMCQLLSDYALHIENVRIECKVHANPGITINDAVWSWPHGEDTITLIPGEQIDDISSSFRVAKGHEFLVTLHFKQLKERHFQHPYTLNVTNAVGTQQETVKLKMKADLKTTTPKTGGSISAAGGLGWSPTLQYASAILYASWLCLRVSQAI